MWMLWLLWGTIAIGCLFVGIGSIFTIYTGGFDLALLINAVLYTGCGLYGLPKFLRLFVRKG